MRIEQIVEDAVRVARNHGADELIGDLGIAGTCPHIDLVRLRPAGTAHAADLQGGLGRLHPRRIVLVDEGARIQADELRGVAVQRALVCRAARAEVRDRRLGQASRLCAPGRGLLEPLLHLALRTDHDRLERITALDPARAQILIDAQVLGRLDRHGVQLPHQRLVVSRAIHDGSLLRGKRRRHHQAILIGTPPQKAVPKHRHLAQHRVDALAQHPLITREAVLVVGILQRPRRPRYVPAVLLATEGGRAAKGVVLRVDQKAPALPYGRGCGIHRLHACRALRRDAARHHERFEVIGENRAALGEIGLIGRPIVHLNVHIEMKVRAPIAVRAAHHPDTAQVAGQLIARPRRSDGEITAELVDELLGRTGGRTRSVVRHELIGGDVRHRAAQIEMDSREEGGIIIDVHLAQLIEGARRGLVQAPGHLGVQRLTTLSAAIRRIGILVVSARRIQNRDGIGPADRQATSRVRLHRAALGQHTRLHLTAHAIVGHRATERQRLAFGARGARQPFSRTRGKVKRVHTRARCLKAHHHDAIGMAREVTARVANTTGTEIDRCDARREIQIAHIALRLAKRGATRRKIKQYVAEILV